MNRKGGIIDTFVILLIIAGAIYFYTSLTSPENAITDNSSLIIPNETISEAKNSIKIANWNLQIFGDTKESNEVIMQKYTDVIGMYDIIFVQEIRDSDGSAFVSLCSRLPNFQCTNSSRAGRSTSKEQYGIIYKEGLSLVQMTDYNPDSYDRWERPPIKATFRIGPTLYNIYNIHIKPDDVKAELAYLQEVVDTDNENVIVIGDLNADCDYYNPSEPEFDNYTWIITDDMDTTAGDTNCAYDRIILNQGSYINYIDSGIYTETTSEYSDHYLVWLKVRI